MISWWLPYLAKGPTPDFIYGPGNDLNSGCILALQRLIESDFNNGPSPSHSNLMSDEVYICSSLQLMIPWWLPDLAKGPTPDFNKGLRMTSIVTLANLDSALGQVHLNETIK